MFRTLHLSEYPTMFGKIFRFTLFRLLENEFVKFPSWHDLTIGPSMLIEKTQNFMKASIILFLLFSMGVLKPMPLAYQIARFFKVLYLMNEECIMRPALACPRHPRSQFSNLSAISVSDLLDFLNAVENSSEIQGSIQEVVKWAKCSCIL